jgi:hypothetical protein
MVKDHVHIAAQPVVPLACLGVVPGLFIIGEQCALG